MNIQKENCENENGVCFAHLPIIQRKRMCVISLHFHVHNQTRDEKNTKDTSTSYDKSETTYLYSPQPQTRDARIQNLSFPFTVVTATKQVQDKHLSLLS